MMLPPPPTLPPVPEMRMSPSFEVTVDRITVGMNAESRDPESKIVPVINTPLLSLNPSKLPVPLMSI